MDRDVNRNKITRRYAVTLLGAGAIVPLGGFKALSSSAFSTTNKPREDLYYTSLTEVGRRIRLRDLSPVDLTQLMLDRIAKFDPRLKSYATVMSEQALADARAVFRKLERDDIAGRFTAFRLRSRICVTPRASAPWAALPFSRIFVPPSMAQLSPNYELRAPLCWGN